MSARIGPGDLVRLGALLILIPLPLALTDFLTLVIGVKALWLGIAAVSLTFLSGHGGMVSLAPDGPVRRRRLHDAKLYVRHDVADWNAVWIGI